MSEGQNRREFLKKTAAASTAALGMGLSGARGGQQNKGVDPLAEKGTNDMPMAQIGDLKVSRLISGGNLISGWAHARDLNYVHDLMRHYNTDEKVLDTMELMEQKGVNTIICDPNKKTLRIFKRYWNERGGEMQWICDTRPQEGNLDGRIQAAIDNGASACYVNGGWADRWHLEDKTLLLNKSVERIRAHGVPAGIGAHSLQTIMACEAADFNPDFYMKTLHHHNYWSAQGGNLDKPVVKNGADNLWAATPEQTKRFMKSVDTPWFAFKAMAAGAIPPKSAFTYAFEGGADCILAGMFDWQVEEDVMISKQVMRKVAKNGRQRPWRA